MSKSEIQQLEEYFLAADKTEFLKKLIVGTDSYYFFSLIEALKNNGYEKLSSNQKDLMKSYENFSTSNAKKIKMISYLSQIQSLKEKPEELQKTLKQLNLEFLHFNFQIKEPTLGMGSGFAFNQEEIPTELDQSKISSSVIFEEVYADPKNNIHNLTKKAWTHFDFRKIINESKELQYALQQCELHEVQNVVALIQDARRIQKASRANLPEIPRDVLNRLTLEQMEEFMSKDPEQIHNTGFVEILIEKKFRYSEVEDKLEKKLEVLELIRKFTMGLPKKYEELSLVSYFEMLVTKYKKNVYDLSLFLKYLDNPLEDYVGISESNLINFGEKMNKRSQNGRIYVNILGINRGNWPPFQEIIEKYLEHFFLQGKPVSTFTEYFDGMFLNQTKAKCDFYAGKEGDVSFFSPHELEKIQNQKLITILKGEKGIFEHGEEVKIDLEVKNISKITVSVFEICLENYYKKNQSEISQEINLEGLIASDQQILTFNEPPVKKTRVAVSLPTISAKAQGVFVVEFIGSEICSRAIIRKGKLIPLVKNTLSGVKVTIMNEKFEVCAGERTGLWLQGKFFEQKDGCLHIPYTFSSGNHNVVLVSDDFSFLGKVQIPNENYDFKCSYFLNKESFLMGIKAKVIIHPRLYIQSEPANLAIIKDAQVKIMIYSNDGTLLSQQTDPLTINSKDDCEIEIPITSSSINRIEIFVSGTITKMDGKSKFEVASSKTISFQNQSEIFCDFYLRKTSEGYFLELLGKNGEPKSGLVVMLQASHKFSNKAFNFKLKTNENGKIKLGKLQDIVTINASLKAIDDLNAQSRIWVIPASPKNSLPNNIVICEGDKLVIPYNSRELSRHAITFVKINQQLNAIQTDLLSHLKLGDHTLEIENLPIGVYALKFKETSDDISVVVKKGKYWMNSPNYIITDDFITETSKDVSFLSVEDIKANGSTLNFKVKTDKPEYTRAHVILCQYVPENYYSNINEFLNAMVHQRTGETEIPKLSAVFSSNKRLGDENVYVLDRKNQGHFLGVNLERPQLLLKRQYVRDTNFDAEELRGETGFGMTEGIMEAQASMRMAKHADKRREGISSIQLSNLNNFITNEGKVISNLKIDETGNASVEGIDLNKYSFCYILASNLFTVADGHCTLNDAEVGKNDLTHKCKKKADEYYSISREFKGVVAGEKLKFEDASSTEFKVIDSLEKLYFAQRDLCNQQKKDFTEYKNFDFLPKWEKMTIQEQHEKYNEFGCHELNIFLYFKDRAYFETYVKPFLVNKIEKQIIDFFLIGDHVRVLEFANSFRFAKLNALEMVLLLISLIENGKDDDAKYVVEYMTNSNKCIKYDSKTFKKLFDTIISSKALGKIDYKGPDIVLQADKEESKKQHGGVTLHQRRLSVSSNEFCENLSEEDYEECENKQMECYAMEENCMVLDSPARSESSNSSRPRSEVRMRSAPKKKQMVQKRMLRGGPMMKKKMANNYSNFEEDFEKTRFGQNKGYEEIEVTKEYKETQYKYPHHFGANSYWTELANHIFQNKTTKGFLSPQFIYALNFPEMVSALAFSELLYSAKKSKLSSTNSKDLEIEFASASIIFCKAIQRSKLQPENDILIAQKFYDPKDRFYYNEDEPDVKLEKDVEEFLINKIYGSKVILTNCSVAQQEFQILTEIPEGSVPVATNEYTKVHSVVLNPFTTHIIEYRFYFPHEGEYSMYPANVSKNEKVIAVAPNLTLKVKTVKESKNLESISDILRRGTKKDIIDFIASKNILNPNIFQFNSIYYLLKQKDFYQDIISVLKKRKIFDLTIWSFSIEHGDIESLKELLSEDSTQSKLKSHLKSFQNDVVKIENNQILEYNPLTNSRFHMLQSEKSNILNKQFREKYQQFLQFLIETKDIRPEHYMQLAYYLLLQDRIVDAIKIYEKVNTSNLQENQAVLQNDYFRAYISFHKDYPKFTEAREICDKYLDYPIIAWRNRFYEIANQLAEYDEEAMDEEVIKTDKKISEKEADKEESLAVELVDKNLMISIKNIEEITISFYQIDLEILFSRNPFLQQGSDDFSFVKAQRELKFKTIFKQSWDKVSCSIPEDLENQNLFVLVKSKGQSASTTYYSSSLEVQVIENYGQIKVTNKDGKSVSKAYVKVFFKNKSGKASYYKDGYTDLRGRFDYASVTNLSIHDVDKFSIFVTSEEFGSVTKEVKPPLIHGKAEVVQLQGKTWQTRAKQANQMYAQNYQKNRALYM